MTQPTREDIIEANKEVHKEEAEMYDVLVPEIFCASEQRVVNTVIDHAISAIDKEQIIALDVGAGTGNISLKLNERKQVTEIFAVDLSPEMIDQLESKLPEQHVIKTAVKDIDSFLADTTVQFDLITVSSVLHHLPDYVETIETMKATLAPGGVLILFHEPSGEHSVCIDIFEWFDFRLFLNFFLPKRFRKKAKEMDYSLSDFHVYHDFDMNGIKASFEKDEEYEILYFLRHNVFKLAIFRLLGRMLPKKNNFILSVLKRK